MSASRVQLLDAKQIQQKLVRIAFQIMEENFDEKEIALVGIKQGGFKLAQQLQKILKKHSVFAITLASVEIDKQNPLDNRISIEPSTLDKKVVVIVDDVANTGRTLCYAMTHFQNTLPKAIQMAVLVDRRHKAFPIRPDYVGLSLATTLKEHINVDLSGSAKVYLS